MTPTERKALNLANLACGTSYHNFDSISWPELRKAICRLIDEHEAFKQAVSNAVGGFARYCTTTNTPFPAELSRFIPPKPVDPLVEAMSEAMCGVPGEDYERPAQNLRAELAKRGLKIVDAADG